MKLPTPPIYAWLGFHAAGDIGGMTLYTAKDKGLVIFLATSPKKPASIWQIHHRNRLRLVATLWYNLLPEHRAAWTRAATKARLRISGFNLFTFTLLADDQGPARTVSSQAKTPLTFPGRIPR